MSSMNLVILIGHLGRDPEVRYLPDGTAFTNISLATSESWTDKASGEKKERTEWHRVNFAGRLAEVAAEYLKKGSLCCVRGRLHTRKWQAKDGTDRYTTEIRADELKMLGGRSDNSPSSPSSGESAAAARAPTKKAMPDGQETAFDDLNEPPF